MERMIADDFVRRAASLGQITEDLHTNPTTANISVSMYLLGMAVSSSMRGACSMDDELTWPRYFLFGGVVLRNGRNSNEELMFDAEY